MASTSLDLIVHVSRDRDHHRFVSEVVQVHTGQLDEAGYPSTERLFEPGPDGRAVPTGRKPDTELGQRLAGVGFDANWLTRGASTWDRLPANPVPTREGRGWSQ